MSIGTIDSLGRYYWCKTANTTDANYWYFPRPKRAMISEYIEF